MKILRGSFLESTSVVDCSEYSKPVVFNLFSAHTPRDTSPLNFVPPKLLVQDFILE
jgi:hypothetical protein